MKKSLYVTVSLIILATISLNDKSILAHAGDDPAVFWQQSDESNSETIDHTLWQNVLDDFLVSNDSSGVNRVDYHGLAQQSETLVEYIATMTKLDPRDHNRREQFAYWVNLYNALTINLIIQHYPVESITKISKGFFSFGPWDDDIATISGQTISLNDIEHQILRVFWRDHRIHFAVNCASFGCPNVQPQAFTSSNSEDLLQLSGQQYLQHPRALTFTQDGLVLSSIFKWYKDDFGGNEQEVLTTLGQYIDGPGRAKLSEFSGRISYEYNWELNDIK